MTFSALELANMGPNDRAGMDKIRSDIQRASLDTPIDLYHLDLSAIEPTLATQHYYFFNGKLFDNNLYKQIIFNGITYVAWPIEASGFEWSSKGTLPRPKVSIANIDGELRNILNQTTEGDILGARLTRIRTFLKYLDAANFQVDPGTSDPYAKFPDEIYFVDRKAEENRVFITYELASAIDLEGVLLPKRQCIQNICMWKYKSPECEWDNLDYTSTPVYFDSKDRLVNNPAEDSCGKRLKSCQVRFYRKINPDPIRSINTASTGGSLIVGTIITITTTTAHNCATGDTISLDGFSTSGYNGTYSVNTTTSETQLTVLAISALGNATGSGTTKVLRRKNATSGDFRGAPVPFGGFPGAGFLGN